MINHLLCICIFLINFSQQSSPRLLDKYPGKVAIFEPNEDEFKKYVLNPEKDYSVFVLFTILKSQECVICEKIYNEYSIVANSFKTSSAFKDGKVYIMLANYKKNPEIFHLLNFQSVPKLLHFGPKISTNEIPVEKCFEAEAIASWMSFESQTQIKVSRPLNYKLISKVLGAFVTLLLFAIWQRKNLKYLFSRYMFALLALAFVYIMLSGHMWIRIRKPPFMHMNHQTKKPMYIAPGGSSQFVAESYIIIALHVAITLGIILLKVAVKPDRSVFVEKENPSADSTSKKGENGSYKSGHHKHPNSTISSPSNALKTINSFFANAYVKKGVLVIGLLLLTLFYSQLLSIFRYKYGNYPYSFLFK